jgi:arylsulfatase A-like enzyme
LDWDAFASQGTVESPTQILHTLNPIQHGWEFFSGSLEVGLCTSGGDVNCDAGYDDWTSVSATLGDTVLNDGQEQQVSYVWREKNYATNEDIDRTLSWVTQVGLTDPWFAMVAFRAAHTPLHDASPFGCTTSDLTDLDLSRDIVEFLTMTECMDTGIGRLLDGLASIGELDNTVIIVAGDNGTPSGVGEGAFDRLDRGKGTAFESGVRVPLTVTDGAAWQAAREGRPVATTGLVADPGRITDRPVLLLDLYATIAEMLGADASAGVDSRSFLEVLVNPAAQAPVRMLYTENSRADGQLIVGHAGLRNRRGQKFVVRVAQDPADAGQTCMHIEQYDIVSDPLETQNLFYDASVSTARKSLLRALTGIGQSGAEWLLTGFCED